MTFIAGENESCGVTGDGNVIPRVKPLFPRKVYRDAEDTGNERESKHGDGSSQFCEDYKIVFVSKPRLIWRLWYQFPSEAYISSFGWIWMQGKCLWRLQNTEMKTTFDADSELFRKTESR